MKKGDRVRSSFGPEGCPIEEGVVVRVNPVSVTIKILKGADGWSGKFQNLPENPLGYWNVNWQYITPLVKKENNQYLLDF